jgi:hypothetical protein
MPRARTLLVLLLVVTVFAVSLSDSESIGDGSQVRRIIYPSACMQILLQPVGSMRACSMLVVSCVFSRDCIDVRNFFITSV